MAVIRNTVTGFIVGTCAFFGFISFFLFKLDFNKETWTVYLLVCKKNAQQLKYCELKCTFYFQ